MSSREQLLSIRARLEDTRTDLEVMRDDSPVGSSLWNRLQQMIDHANLAIRDTQT